MDTTTTPHLLDTLPRDTETRGYIRYVAGDGSFRRDAGWFYVNAHGHVICRRIGGRRSWVYRSAQDVRYGFCDHLTFVADPTAR